MTEELLQLARQAQGLPGFEWRPGMLDADGVRVLHVGLGEVVSDAIDWDGGHETISLDLMDYPPDLTDEATGGVLLAMLGDWVTAKRIAPDEWWLRVGALLANRIYGRTLAEACCKAAIARGCWGPL